LKINQAFNDNAKRAQEIKVSIISISVNQTKL